MYTIWSDEVEEVTQKLNTATAELVKLADEYAAMKTVISETDKANARLEEDNSGLKLQVQDLQALLIEQGSLDNNVMTHVNSEVEKWKKLLSETEEKLVEERKRNHILAQQLDATKLDADKKVMAELAQAAADKDKQIEVRWSVFLELFGLISGDTRSGNPNCRLSMKEWMPGARLVIYKILSGHHGYKMYTGCSQKTGTILNSYKSSPQIFDFQELKKELDEGYKQMQLMGEFAEELQASEAVQETNHLEKLLADYKNSAKAERERLRKLEADSAERDKQLAEALTRIGQYEKGTYGLGEAVQV